MNKKAIQAMLRLADAFDSKGDTESADAIEQLLLNFAEEDKTPEQPEMSPVHARQIANALVRVADSLDRKGAHREAQMADNLLNELSDIVQEQSAIPVQEAPMPTGIQDTIVSVEPSIDEHNEAPEVSEVASLPETEIIEPQEADPEFDELTIEELEELVGGMRLQYSQRAKREQYQKVLEKARQAQEYKDAADAWLSSAHEEFGEDPIRVKI